MVICYGVIQHTGNNQKAILELAKFPKKGGLLLMDIYSTSLRHFNPLIYLIRPFFSLLNVDDQQRLNIVEGFVKQVFPIQLRTLRLLHKRKGYVIKEYFSNYYLHFSDVTFDIKKNHMKVHRQNVEPWRVTLVDTFYSN